MLSTLIDFFNFFANRLRLSKPWSFKIPVLIAVFYFVLIIGDNECYTPLVTFLSSILIVIGVAGIGYLTNDLGDIEKDKLISKPNATAQLNKGSIVLIFVLFLTLAILPWLYLPFNYKSAGLFCLEFLLFFIYAFKPFRFKEKGLLGIVTDALYAHAVPSLLAAYTYFMVVKTPKNSFWWFILCLCSWQFFLGLRNILLHQIGDYNNDLESKTKTFVTEKGVTAAQKLCKYFFFAEIVLFTSIIVFLSKFNIFFFAGPIIYWIVMAFRKRKTIKKISTKEIMYLFFDDLYLDWLPLFALVLLINGELSYWVIFILHILLFRNRIKYFVRNSFVYRKVINGFRTFFQGGSGYAYDFRKQCLVFIVYLCLFIGSYFSFDFAHQEQLYLSRALVGLFFIHIILVITFQYVSIRKIVENFIYESGSAVNLAIFRIFIFLLLTGHFIYISNVQSSWSFLPDEQRVELPYMNWLLSILPVSPQLFKISCYSAAVLSFFVAIGLFTRWVSLAIIPFAFYSLGVPMLFGKISHYHIMFWIPLILCFSPLSDALSFDNLLSQRKSKAKPFDAISYAIPFKFIWISLAIIYFFAGIHKLWESGLEWALGDSMVNQIQWEWVENYDKIPAFRIDHYPILAKTGGLLVIIFECIYPIFIFSKRLRWMALFGAFAMHLTIGYFMNIDFVFLRLLSLSYIDWHGIIKYFKKKDKGLQPKTGYYNITTRDRIGIYISSLLVVSNLLCSAFKVHSYPFSSYPTYSALTKDKIDILVMEPIESNLTYSEIIALAKAKKFRWESVRRIEHGITEKYLKGDTLALNTELINYWNIWATNFEKLKQVRKVGFYIKSYSIVPEHRKVVIDSIYLKQIIVK